MTFQQFFPVTDPIWTCFVVLAIILIVPLIAHKTKFPQIAALIIAGVIIGSSCLNILTIDNMIQFCSKIGLLFIMFFAGLDMDITEMKRTGTWGVAFGFITFVIPFLLCMAVGIYILHISLPASMLMGCVLSSQTLISYPIISKYGLSKHPSVTISVTGALIAILLALIGNSFIRSAFTPDIAQDFNIWIFVLKFILYVTIIVLVFPRITRYFFRKYNNGHAHFLFVFMLLALSSGLASIIGLEGILGAFLAGLILSRYIPHSSPLMNRIDFVGNTLFIPIFLLSTGMIIDLSNLLSTPAIIVYFLALFSVGTLGKWITALIVQKGNGFDRDGRLLLFGLSVSHAAGALAITMGAFSLGLIDNALLSSTILIVLFSCVTSNVITENVAKRMHQAQLTSKPDDSSRKVLVMLNNPLNTHTLVETVIALMNPRKKAQLVGLHITINGDHAGKYLQAGKKELETAAALAAAADVPFVCQNRIGNNVIESIIHSSEEYEVTDLVLGLTVKEKITRKYYYDFIQQLVSKTGYLAIFSRLSIPLSTIRRVIVLVTEGSATQPGFDSCIDSISRLITATGCDTRFYSNEHILDIIKSLDIMSDINRVSYESLSEIADVDWTLRDIHADHLLIVIGDRNDTMEEGSSFGHIFDQIHTISADCGIMLMFPKTLSGATETQGDIKNQVTNRTDRDLLKLLRM